MQLDIFDGKWNYQNTPFTGVATRKDSDMREYYRYCSGSPCGYVAFHPNGDTAGIHTYHGDEIDLVFYTPEGKKTLEYHQKILDNTYINGEWCDYRDDGTLQVKGNYTLIHEPVEGRGGRRMEWQSVKDGKWYFYNEKEKLIRTETWKKGKLKKTKTENEPQ
jgi:antitoxin component YwqK of YwqJK toxin-antitoxin module